MGAGRIGARQVRFWMFRLRYTLPTFTIPDLSRSALSRSACPLCLPRSACRSAPVPLCPPIVRTAGADRSKRELSRDLAYLLRLWKVIVRRIKKMPAPVDIYQESDMIIRTIRDIFTADVDTIYIDEQAAYERAREFLQLVMPRYVNRLQHYEGKEPLFSSTAWTRKSPRSMPAPCP